jgi:hypothetical protein
LEALLRRNSNAQIRHRTPVSRSDVPAIAVEAENLEEACEKAVSDDIDWDTQEMDCDSARATTITEAKVIPEGCEADVVHSLIIASRDPRGLPLDMLSLASFLYEDEAKTGLLLEIPAKFTEDE